jgi:hypothetical protein
MTIAATWLMAGVLIVLGSAAAAAPPTEEEAPAKRGGMLTYMIPADAPPSFDGHREATFATLQAMAPFYSVLIRINPENPSSTTDFVCDLCTAIPQPTTCARLSHSRPMAGRPTPSKSAKGSSGTTVRR